MSENEKKSNILFKEAMNCYKNQQYEKALKLFESSVKFFPNDRAELFIKICKSNIPETSNSYSNSNSSSNGTFSKKQKQNTSPKKQNNNTNENSNNHQNSQTSQNSNSSFDNNSDSNSNNDNNSNDTIEEDKKCKELLKKKDYYDLLNIPKTASQDEIKRAYKKQAVKFHPDKNHSKLAGECFKKISEAYQCLSNTEKKEFYDKYGNEEEFRQKYYATHQYYEQEMDPYDIFDILFGNDPRMRGRRRNRNMQFNNVNIVNLNKYHLLIVFIPVILMILIELLPNIYKVIKGPPLYQFQRNSVYNIKKKTRTNRIEFYVRDKFVEKYPRNEDYLGIEGTIEKEYLSYLYDKCNEVIQQKNTIQYYMAFSYSISEKRRLKKELENLNYHYCNRYNDLRYKIDN